MKSKNTKPELKVRSYLFSKGFRFKIHDIDLPGSPDIVLPKYKIVININGCFWHQHGCTCTKIPNTKKEFWYNKFKEIKSKDVQNRIKLEKLGWNVIDLWECSIMNEKSFNNLLKTFFFKIAPVENNIKYVYV
jgi:DNA mismatch endonuclease (patch repair protein)